MARGARAGKRGKSSNSAGGQFKKGGGREEAGQYAQAAKTSRAKTSKKDVDFSKHGMGAVDHARMGSKSYRTERARQFQDLHASLKERAKHEKDPEKKKELEFVAHKAAVAAKSHERAVAKLKDDAPPDKGSDKKPDRSGKVIKTEPPPVEKDRLGDPDYRLERSKQFEALATEAEAARDAASSKKEKDGWDKIAKQARRAAKTHADAAAKMKAKTAPKDQEQGKKDIEKEKKKQEKQLRDLHSALGRSDIEPQAAREQVDKFLEQQGFSPDKKQYPNKTFRAGSDEELGGAFAVHHWDGEIVVDKKEMMHFQTAAEAFWKKGRAMTKEEEGALSTVVHESFHGFGPMKSGEYKGTSALIEEVATETAARHMTRKMIGWQRSRLDAPDNSKDDVFSDAYGGEIAVMRKVVAAHHGLSDEQSAHDRMVEASLKYKKSVATGESMVQIYHKHLGPGKYSVEEFESEFKKEIKDYYGKVGAEFQED